ncbi:MAG TPA: carboxypeptidase regulatory-like domain-containing protein, partial [Thermoplasmatales archaeon]|nr:carboxypeptidase regulatory-like domain-containing protein [Thermoplasmatales archaeon]
PFPPDESIDVEVNPTLSVYVEDPDNNDLDVYFYDATSNSLIGAQIDVSSGNYAAIDWYDLDYDTTYYWYVIVYDEYGEYNQSNIWSFTTMSQPTQYYTLTTSVNPSEGGYIEPPGGSYEAGTQVTVTAYAYDGYVFDHWSGDVNGNNPTIQITMNSDKTIVAHFTEITTPVVDVEITRPVTGYLYIKDAHSLPRLIKNKAFIIGPITINVSAESPHGIKRVDFYLDGEYLSSDTIYPYEYRLNIRSITTHNITVVAYDWEDNSATDYVLAFIFNPIPRKYERSGVLKGKIIDGEKPLLRKGIARVNITVVSMDDLSLVKNIQSKRIPLINKGRYSIKLKPGRYIITVSAPGYNTVEKQIRIIANKTTRENFYLYLTETESLER